MSSVDGSIRGYRAYLGLLGLGLKVLELLRALGFTVSLGFRVWGFGVLGFRV